MELEVSKKVRDAIKAKLLELGCHVDDELPDYIMILIANRRNGSDMESDLTLFLGDNTKKFVSWLTHVLKKLEQVTATEGGIMPMAADVPEAQQPSSSAVMEEEEGTRKSKKTKSSKPKRKHSKDDVDDKSEKSVSSSKKRDEQVVKDEMSKNDESFNTLESYEDVMEAMSTNSELENLNIVTTSEEKVNNETKQDYEAKVTSTNYVNYSIKKFERVPISLSSSGASGGKKHDDGSHHDTLILDSGENEFTDNLEELRRIALESQEKKRRDKEKEEELIRRSTSRNKSSHQRKLITNILMSTASDAKDSPKLRLRPRSDRKSRSPEYSRIKERCSRERERSSRTLRSSHREERRSSPERKRRISNREPERETSNRSIFTRIGHLKPLKRESRSSSRSRSRSPVKKMTSKIGSVIHHRSPSPDRSPPHHSVSSVIKVTDRPKRDLKLNNKMLLRAVADAQQSIIRNNSPSLINEEQHTPYHNQNHQEIRGRKRISDENLDVVGKRRFNEFPEVISSDFYEPTDSVTRRKSIKERLGVKRETRRPVKERLGILPSLENMNISAAGDSADDLYEGVKFSPSDDYKILINVNDSTSIGANGKMRNVMLASNESKRISIQINNSEEDDTSDESFPPSPVEPIEKITVKKTESNNKAEKDHSDDEFELAVYEEDKLPEVPSNEEAEQEEYEFEEIVEEYESNSKDGFTATNGKTVDLNVARMSQASSDATATEPTFSITINKAAPVPKPVILPPLPLPDLRTLIKSSPSLPKAVSPGANGSAKLKCKYWPKCQFKDTCIYEHPKCKFNPCKNKECVYKHEAAATDQVGTPPKLICKFYPKCTSMNCKFLHPSPCRFGVGCTDPRCESYHPGVTIGLQKLKAKGVTLLPQANQLKWVKK